MDALLRYRGRDISQTDVEFIRGLVASHPGASRRALSKKLCEAWGMVQPNGALRDMVCRGLMLALARTGHIELPPVRFTPSNPLSKHQKPAPVEVDCQPLRCNLRDLGQVTFRQVRRVGAEERLFNGLIEAHHYLGYTQPVGEHLKFLAYAQGRPVACVAWSSAPRHLAPRDHFIGWLPLMRRKNIRFVAYNTRFLILPWVEVPHLASHLLGRMVRLLPGEWERVYGHPVWFAETFVDREKFKGTCYRAANWVYLGQTTGRGKNAPSKRANRSLKDVLGYPLVRDFRERLTRET